MKALLREPLVHFLLAGAALFWFYGGTESADRRIVIDEAQVARLAAQWEQQWRRPPGPAELDALIRDHIKEEVYFREAMRLGLDADDPIIRRRLRGKMEFLAISQIENAVPAEAELARFYTANKARYAADPVYDFEQLYFGDDAAAARRAIATLKKGGRPPVQAISLPPGMDDAPASAIAREFGDGFAQALRELPAGQWAGPVQSGFGWHAVRVTAAKTSGVPPLASVRQRVVNDWRAATLKKREAAAYQALLDGYDIDIEKP